MGKQAICENKAFKLKAGDRVGRWTVSGESILTERNQRKWLCRCDCGTERYVLERSLLYGGSESCGCLRREEAAKTLSYDLQGQVFGQLTVLHKAEYQRKNGGIWWTCQCSCGNLYDVSASMLLTGKRTHCGSNVHQKNYAYTDIQGQKFHHLTALFPTNKRDNKGSVIWHCRCDCGNEVDIPYNTLAYSNIKSCGCQKKGHDEKLKSFLTHVAGTSLDMLKSKKLPKDNTTGCKGVYLIRGKYVAKIVFQKKQYYLGSYDKIEEAINVRKEAERVLFDGFAEHYCKWKECADNAPEWAEENPIQVVVNQVDGKLDVCLLPNLSEL